MEQLEADFTTELNPGNLKDAMKAAGASSGDLWKLPVSRLRIIEGFNVRVHNAKYQAQIDALVDSMVSEGYYPNKPMSGYIQRDAAGQDLVYIYDGHTRLLAIPLANAKLAAQGRPLIEEVTVIAATKKGKDVINMVDLNVAMVQGNKSNPLSAYGCAIVCKRLAADNVPVVEIARRLGFSTEWVNSLLLLMSAPQELRERVANDELTVTLAVELLKEHGNEAAEMVEEAAAAKAEDGKPVRITRKHIKPANPFTKLVKRSAPAMYEALVDVKKDAGFASLAPETREKLLELMEKFEESKQDGAVDHSKQVTIFDATEGNGGAAPSAAA
jgi:ParB family transcriptional regulator, chromosome partitioning protein